MTEHLDFLVSVGGKYVRNTMSDRDDGNEFAFAQVEDGVYDLEQWNQDFSGTEGGPDGRRDRRRFRRESGCHRRHQDRRPGGDRAAAASEIARMAVDQVHEHLQTGSTDMPEKQAVDCILVTPENADEFGVFERL